MDGGPQIGARAPDFGLLAAGSGRRVGVPPDGAGGSDGRPLRRPLGRPLVLIFHLQGTAPTAREINRAVRARYPSPEEVLVASVIDLSIVPPVYWLTVGLVLNTAYEEAAKEVPPNVDPADYVAILPDWGGLVSRRYGARNTGRAAAISVVDADANLAGSYQGERPVEAVLGALEPLIESAASGGA